ncbi:MAG: hypothetical protein P8M05_08535 [Flavobacteriales bacterium]|nr:hypothetical protein [Flavobacteriales bacterium]
MKNLVLIFATLVLLFSSCGSNEVLNSDTSYTATIWLGTYDAMQLVEGEENNSKELQGKLDVLMFLADKTFMDCSKYSIHNKEATSTFEIEVSGQDTVKVKEALNSYLDIIEGGYEIRVIEETHPVD